MAEHIVVQEVPCSVCHETLLCRHYEIYAFGSEGVWLCHRHQRLADVIPEYAVELIAEMARLYLDRRKAEHLARRLK